MYCDVLYLPPRDPRTRSARQHYGARWESFTSQQKLAILKGELAPR